MAQISINNLTFGYEGSFDYVFENVSFSIDTNWKLGFIGRNGKGKTTFLNLLLGKYQFTGSISASTKFDYFPYEIAEYQKQMPVAEFMEDLKPGCEIWRVICELEELSESSEILYRPYCTLSPGECTKILLAVLFSQENEFLLIDERVSRSWDWNYADETDVGRVKRKRVYFIIPYLRLNDIRFRPMYL